MPASELRDMLAHALLEAGPDALTLCEGWRTRHLAAHLVLREHEPWRLAGLAIPSQRPAVDELTVRVGDESASEDDYRALVERFAAGPGAFSPWRPIDGPANVLEYAVHLEDVIRGAGLPPVEYPPELLQEIWRYFEGRARGTYRSTPARLALIADDRDGGERLAIGAHKKDQPLIVVRGRLMDIVLMAFGRPADVEATGPDDAVFAFFAGQKKE